MGNCSGVGAAADDDVGELVISTTQDAGVLNHLKLTTNQARFD